MKVFTVVPVKAGTHADDHCPPWIPAFSGMTILRMEYRNSD